MVVHMAEHSARILMAKGGPATAAQGRVQYRGAGASTIPKEQQQQRRRRRLQRQRLLQPSPPPNVIYKATHTRCLLNK